MFSKKKAAPKKRSWELDADDDQPSAEFLKIQVEIAERERLIQEHSAAAAAEAERVEQEQEQQKIEQQKKEAASGDPLRPCDSQAAYLAEVAVPDAGATIVVANFHPKTRIHEMKQHFLQFGDLIEIALVGKQAFVTFERTKDANDALLDGALAPLNGKRLAISAAPADHRRPSGGFHGPSRWHRDDAIKKKEGMMADREARHEFNKREASERRGREKEQLDREKERNARRAAEEAARREAAEARKLLESGNREGGGGGGSGESDGTRRRSRSRSRDRARRPSPPRRDRDSSNSERRDRSGSPPRRSRSRDRDRDRGRESHSGERSRDHR